MSNKIKPWNSNCPSCDSSYAYAGFNTVECITWGCKHYTQKQRDEFNEYCNQLTVELTAKSEATYVASVPEESATVNKDADDDNVYVDPYSITFP